MENIVNIEDHQPPDYPVLAAEKIAAELQGFTGGNKEKAVSKFAAETVTHFCEENVFHESVLYISKLEKDKRRAVCRHCGRTFKVDREVKPGGFGVCPKCGWPVNYRADWVKDEVAHKAKICIAYKVRDFAVPFPSGSCLIISKMYPRQNTW